MADAADPVTLPTTPDQEDRLGVHWWCQDAGLGSPSRMSANAYRLSGPFDIEALRRSLDVLIERHEALRVAFPGEGRTRRQVIMPPAPADVRYVDLRQEPAERRFAEAKDRLTAYLQGNTELDSALRISGIVLRLADDDHILGLAIDHLVVDGEAFTVLAGELWEAYSAIVDGRPPVLPALGSTYRDFVRWEADWLANDEEPRRIVRRFAELLQGVGPNPKLSLDGRDPAANAGYHADMVRCAFPPGARALLTAGCSRVRATPFNVLLSAYLCALHSMNGRTDFGVVIPVSRRTRRHLLRLVGWLTTSATIRVELDLGASFESLCKEVQSTVFETRQLCKVTGSTVTAAIAPHMWGRLLEFPCNDFDVTPWNWTGGRQDLGGLVVSPLPEWPDDVPMSQGLEVFASTSDEEVELYMTFPDDVYEPEVVTELSRRFVATAQAALSEPGRSAEHLIRSVVGGG